MADVADEIALASEVANVEDPEAAVKSEEPEAKRARTEAAAEDAKSAEEAGAVAGKEGDAKPEPETIKRDPIKIGYKTFSSGVDCYKYFHNLIVKYRKNQDLNEVSQ